MSSFVPKLLINENSCIFDLNFRNKTFVTLNSYGKLRLKFIDLILICFGVFKMKFKGINDSQNGILRKILSAKLSGKHKCF